MSTELNLAPEYLTHEEIKQIQDSIAEKRKVGDELGVAVLQAMIKRWSPPEPETWSLFNFVLVFWAFVAVLSALAVYVIQYLDFLKI